MTQTHLVSGLLATLFAVQLWGCSGAEDNTSADGSDEAGSGGALGSGGVYSAAGGADLGSGGADLGSGGAAIPSSGGAEPGTGGTNPSSGGAPLGSGGDLTGSGGDLTGSGGDLTGSGGDLTGSGGDLTGSGGDLTGSGGDLTGSGGGLTGSGGDPTGSGGTGTGGETLGSGGATAGATGTAGTAGADPATGGANPGVGGSGVGGSSSISGCGQTAPTEPPATVDVDGTQRTFILDVPTNYDPNTPTPIVFGFHGMSTSGSMFRGQYYGNLGSTLADDFLLVHPDALGDPTAWESQGTSDVEFFDAMLELLASLYCVDEARVFATGHSSGGFFSNHLACQRGDVLRAIAPVSGGGPFVFGSTTCSGQVAAMLIHGTTDDTVAISNGEDSRDHWGGENSCNLAQSTVVTTAYPCIEYADCDSGFPVQWCEYDGAHEWPDFAPQAMYDFFSSL